MRDRRIHLQIARARRSAACRWRSARSNWYVVGAALAQVDLGVEDLCTAAGRPRHGAAALEQRAAGLEVELRRRRALRVQGRDDGLDVAEAFGQLDRPLARGDGARRCRRAACSGGPGCARHRPARGRAAEAPAVRRPGARLRRASAAARDIDAQIAQAAQVLGLPGRLAELVRASVIACCRASMPALAAPDREALEREGLEQVGQLLRAAERRQSAARGRTGRGPGGARRRPTAWRAARGANSSTASRSCAASAWWARHAASTPFVERRTCNTRRCRARRCGVDNDSRIACRASSWRNSSVAPTSRNTPAPRQASSVAASAPATLSSCAGSMRGPSTAAASSTDRAAGGSGATRASTASRTVGGTADAAPSANSSVTKKGLPPLTAVQGGGVERAAARPGAARHRPTAAARVMRAAPCKRAEQAPQGMGAADLVVAVGAQQQRARALDAPAEVGQQVERRLVGPMQVFEHQAMRVAAQCVEHRGEDLEAAVVAAEGRRHASRRAPWRCRAAGRAGAA